MVSVALAIVLGLLASFIQSLGLTIQRKSHLIAAKQPVESRPPEWRQPIWVIGFLIFIIANIGGTVFQIGALPIVMLAPLGAISLLYNALLAKFLLQDALGLPMVVGTALILLGAVLIGYFGAIQEAPHSLDELLALFGRPPFIALATILFMAFMCVLILAHLAEWQLTMQQIHGLHQLKSNRKSKGKKKAPTHHHHHHRLSRRWSAPMLAPLDEVPETTSGVATPVLEVRDREASQLQPRPQRDYGSFGSALDIAHGVSQSGSHPKSPNNSPDLHRSGRRSSQAEEERINAQQASFAHQRRLVLSVAFAAVSGTLSGVCLLLAKSGVELLVLTFGLGRNQFNRVGSWALVVIMIVAALAQLWYLNKALKLADPTLVCPLAFCFYNTSSIALGLVYFDQLGDIPTSSLLLVVLGIIILLAGVFIVSTKPSDTGDMEQGSIKEDTLISAEEGSIEDTSQDFLTSSPTETEALLANAGGIAGPHLPPPPATAVANDTDALGHQQRRRSRSGSSSSSTSTSSVKSTGSTSSRRQDPHGVSSPTRATAGLGLHLPRYYMDNEFGHRQDSSLTTSPKASPRKQKQKQHQRRSMSSSQDDGIEGGATLTYSPSSSPSPSSHPSPTRRSQSKQGSSQSQSPLEAAADISPTQHQRRPSQSHNLYSTILNRGLSIGFSPSSPGFQIGPFSPSLDNNDYDDDNERRREVERRDRQQQSGPGKKSSKLRQNRRTFSEADLESSSILSGDVGGAEEQANEVVEEGPSRKWFKSVKKWWTSNVTRSDEDEVIRRNERRGLLSQV
ncbi:unnamed protein product [Sympodiomycopsis kandeliae]